MGRYDAAPVPPPALHPCPRCGLTDQVRSVPAVYHAGRSRVTSGSPHGDDVHRTREVVSDLARALAPAPLPDRAPGRTALSLGAGFSVLAVFCFVAGMLAKDFNDDAQGFATVPSRPAFEIPSTVTTVVVLIAAGCFLAGVLLRAAATRDLAGRPRAEHLWAQAWYCARCGTAHFPPTAGLPTGALQLREFRRIVWHAGGYGHLLDRY
ncbi:hypothetical protein ACIRD3_04545 [Kitasatospora sp. NPDC093550]|uniref:hypothetical protein n=1 Tax=Kitasatospora sp. NPDC093550 TaxID=3364089 RepID=UPI00381F511C